MLVITRKRFEKILLIDKTGKLIATITQLGEGSTKIGIDASKEEVEIVRAEILEKRGRTSESV